MRKFKYPLWALIGAAVSYVLTLIFNVLGFTSLASYTQSGTMLFYVSDSIAVLVILYCFTTPIVEELIFRYIIFNFLSKKIKDAIVSILITSALFGIYHLNPVQMLYGFAMGLLITYSYYREKDIFVPITVHSAANAVALIVTLF